MLRAWTPGPQVFVPLFLLAQAKGLKGFKKKLTPIQQESEAESSDGDAGKGRNRGKAVEANGPKEDRALAPLSPQF